MLGQSPDKDEYRRRENGLAVGILLWTIGVVLLLRFYPVPVVTWLESAGSGEIAGCFLLTLGFLGGFGRCVVGLIESWTQSTDNADLLAWDVDK